MIKCIYHFTGEFAYDGPLYARLMAMTNDMLGPSLMHIKYVSYVYVGFAYDRSIFLVPLILSCASSPVLFFAPKLYRLSLRSAAYELCIISFSLQFEGE